MTLIVGGSSFIGRRISEQMENDSFKSTFRSNKVQNGIHFDSVTMKLRDAVDLEEISHAIILVGESNTLLCALEPEQTDKINIDSVKSIIDDCREHGVFPVFVSTDAVFDGEKGQYTEDAAPNPIMRYGKQKLAVERYISQQSSQHLILRPGKVYGTLPTYPTFLSKWMNDLKKGNRIRCATDHVFCPVDIDDFARAVLCAIRQGLSGVYHAGGPEATTYRKLLHLLIQFSPQLKDTANIEEALINDFAVIDKRPIDSSLVSDRLYDVTNISRRSPQDVCRSLSAFIASH